jgi:hypothetical protein
MLATRPQKRLASRPVKGPLDLLFDSVNNLFAILLQKYGIWLERAVFWGFCRANSCCVRLVPSPEAGSKTEKWR